MRPLGAAQQVWCGIMNWKIYFSNPSCAIQNEGSSAAVVQSCHYDMMKKKKKKTQKIERLYHIHQNKKKIIQMKKDKNV